MSRHLSPRPTPGAMRLGRKALATSALAAASLAATLAFATDQASASYTARVTAGTLQISGDSASDKLALVNGPTSFALDVGEDGTADFTFDRTSFTAIDVQA